MVHRFPVIATHLVMASFAMGTIFSIAAPALAQETVTCESNNGRINYCSVDTAGSVRLVRQLSSASCDGNWGYRRNRIWVNNGCRARFLVGDRGNYRDYRNGR